MDHEKEFYAFKKIGITGGTGLIGETLIKMLHDFRYQIIIFTRSKNRISDHPDVTYSHWDWENKIIDGNLLRSCDNIIHLAGAGVMDHRWTKKYKKEIRDSRVLSSQFLIDTLNAGPIKTRALIGASAIGYYGPDKDLRNQFMENDPHAKDFLGELCYEWEQTLLQPKREYIRTCLVRTGIVLSRDGGAFPELKKLFKYKLVPIPGSGNQRLSWIHIADLCRLYIHLMHNPEIKGPVNAVANLPLTLYEFMLRLGKKLKKKYMLINVPGFILKIIKGEGASEILKSTTVSNFLSRELGFVFKFGFIDDCLYDLTKANRLQVGYFNMPASEMEE